ncbi:MAG: hypothetical protein ACO1NY_09075 [Pseudorhodoplanes sp.]
MKLLLGLLAYVVIVGTVIIAALGGLLSVERNGPRDAPVLAYGSDGAAERRARALDEARLDPNRVPVWIAATPKYEYTPVPIDVSRRQRTLIIGSDARQGMASAESRPRPERVEAARPRLRESRRDNDPFFRD